MTIEFKEFVREAAALIRRVESHDRHAKLPIRVPNDDEEARQLCASALSDPAQATTTELALARYLIHRMGPEDATKDRQEPLHPGHIGSAMRLSGRVIERCILLPRDAGAPLPIHMEFHFRDGGRLMLSSRAAVVLVEADGTSVMIPSIPATTTIDDVLARGVDPT